MTPLSSSNQANQDKKGSSSNTQFWAVSVWIFFVKMASPSSSKRKEAKPGLSPPGRGTAYKVWSHSTSCRRYTRRSDMVRLGQRCRNWTPGSFSIKMNSPHKFDHVTTGKKNTDGKKKNFPTLHWFGFIRKTRPPSWKQWWPSYWISWQPQIHLKSVSLEMWCP